MNYAVIMFDEDNKRVAVLENATNPSYNRAKNSASQISVTVPRSDPKISEVQIGRRFEILRGDINDDILEVSGYVTERGFTDTDFEISGYTEEIILTRYRTPDNYGYPLWSENQTLDHFFAEFRHAYHVERAKGDWLDHFGGTWINVDYTSNPQMVLLHGETNDEGVTEYGPPGYIVFRFRKVQSWNASALSSTWERIRWVSDYDEEVGVTTTVQMRQLSSSWSTPVPGALTDVVGLIIPNQVFPDVDVRVNFATTEPTASPVLFAMEAIWRNAIKEIEQVAYPDTETYNLARETATPHIDGDNRTFLDILIDVCEVVGWEFTLVRGILRFSDSFGVDRTNSYTLVEA